MYSIGHAAVGKWRQFTAGSTNRRIFRAAVIVGGLTLTVALATVAREQFVAASFGTSDALDAFLIALVVPNFLVYIVAGSFSTALVPTYVQALEREGQAAAQRILSGVMALSLGLLIVIAGALALASPLFLPFLASGFSPGKLALTQQLFFTLAPIIVLSGLTTIWSSILNARERFAIAALAPIVVQLAAIAALALGSRIWGIHALAFGTVAGFVLQLALLGWALTREGVGIWPRWNGIDPGLRQVIDQFLPMVAGAALLSSTLLVDQAMAAMLDPGSVAALSYGNKVITLIAGLSSTALGTAVLPYFSQMVATADWAGLRHTLTTYSKLILLATIPLTCLLYLNSEFIVRLLFQRGAFTEGNTALVARVQAMYVLQTPFLALGILFVRLFSSLRANHMLLWSAAISLPLNIVLDYALMRIMGVAGIALATSLVYIIALCFLAAMLSRVLRQVSAEEHGGRPA